MKVLVAYESVHGSTRSIAENIARVLGEHAVVTTRTMTRVESLAGYDAFVFGSAEIDGAWLPSACAFLQDHADDVQGRPVWLFSVGISDALPRPLRTARRRREHRQLQECAGTVVHPVSVRVFSGLVTSERTPRRVDRLLAHVWKRNGDFRDWSPIMDWAHEIAASLQDKAGSRETVAA